MSSPIKERIELNETEWNPHLSFSLPIIEESYRCTEDGHSRRESLESRQVHHWTLKQVAQMHEADRQKWKERLEGQVVDNKG